jgi:predicted phosphoribosyltransferase
MADPKVGTGKKPKGSGRRLYTDENPRDTVSIKFATPLDAKKTVAKVKKISKPFARKIQILTVGEQRAKVMKKNKVAAIFKKGKETIRNAKSNTKRLKS